VDTGRLEFKFQHPQAFFRSVLYVRQIPATEIDQTIAVADPVLHGFGKPFPRASEYLHPCVGVQVVHSRDVIVTRGTAHLRISEGTKNTTGCETMRASASSHRGPMSGGHIY
jgi:hypothetical protein